MSPIAVNGLVPEEEKEIDGIVYRIKRWADEKYIYKRIEIDNVQADGPFVYTEKVMKLNEKDFNEMFEKNGLKPVKVYGDYKLNEYQVKHRQDLFSWRKKPKLEA